MTKEPRKEKKKKETPGVRTVVSSPWFGRDWWGSGGQRKWPPSLLLFFWGRLQRWCWGGIHPSWMKMCSHHLLSATKWDSCPDSRQTRPWGVGEQDQISWSPPWHCSGPCPPPRPLLSYDMNGPDTWWWVMAHVCGCIFPRAGTALQLTSGRTSFLPNVSTGCLCRSIISRAREM